MRRALAVCAAGFWSCAPPDGSSVNRASATGSQSPPIAESAEAPSGATTGTTAPPSNGSLPEGSVVPRSVEAMPDARVPFVLVLHGYGGSGARFARHFQLARMAEKRKLIYIAPDGTPDARDNRFWNAGPACCNFGDVDVDHVRELGAILKQASEANRVDPSRIYVVGYSNGGFMAHRLGCDVGGIRGILSVAGAGVVDPSQCAHAPDVVIEVHGDADRVVPFEGGNVLSRRNVVAHPGAIATVTGWANKKGCTASPRMIGALDLEDSLPDAETEHLNFSCAENVTLLKVKGAGHLLASSSPAIDALMDLLMK